MRWLYAIVLAVWMTFAGPSVSYAQEFRSLDETEVLEAAPLSSVPEGWTSSTSNGVVVHGPMRILPLLDELAEHGGERVDALSQELQVPLGMTLHVYVADTPEQFQSMQPSAPPSWADGTAWPQRGLIFLRAPSVRGPGQRPLTVVMDHELVHVLLGRAFAPRVPPRWLQEGYAQVFAGEVGLDTQRTVQTAVARGTLPSLSELTQRFPASAARAHIAYAASASFVGWMRMTYGQDAVVSVTHDMAKGLGVREALRRATGQRLHELERSWEASLPRGLAGLAGAVTEEALFGLGALMALIFGAWRFGSRRMRIRSWRRDQMALSRLTNAVLWRRSKGQAWADEPTSP